MQDVELAEVQQPTTERNQVCCNLGRNRSRERGGGGGEENSRSRGEEEVGLRWGGSAVKNGGPERN